MKSAVIFVALILLCQTAYADVRVETRTFHSASLGRDMRYNAVLPAGYDRGNRRYPVLYLLHGFSGDYQNWVKLTPLADDLKPWPMIVITPDANNSWYVNAATESENRYEDYVTRDLIAEVDKRYRTTSKRGIAGLSMGGYGALLLTLKHPGLYSATASLSGAFEAPCGIEKVVPELQDSLLEAYGPYGNPARGQNDVYQLISAQVPYVYLTCGSHDPLLPSNRRLVELLSSHHQAYEYHEYPGGHDWDYWKARLPEVLAFVAHALRP
ncbi:MAG TPA: alpha/beta hydrolase family protein [Candidatus Xenobia bacterium]